MSLSGGALASGSPQTPNHVARQLGAANTQVLGFWDSQTAVVSDVNYDDQGAHPSLSLRVLNPRSYGVAQFSLEIPDVTGGSVPVSFVPIDDFTALVVTGGVAGEVVDLSNNYYIDHGVNVVRRTTNNFMSIGPRVTIGGAIWNLADDVDMARVFVPIASIGNASSFRLVCGSVGYPKPMRLGYILDASISNDSLVLEQPPHGVFPEQVYASKPYHGYVATIGAGGALVWSDARTSVTLDPDAGRYLGGRPVIVAGDRTFMAWTGGNMSQYNPVEGEIRICKAQGVGPSVISDPIALPEEIANPGPYAQPENLIVDVELAQAPLDPGRVPIVAVMSDTVAAQGGYSGSSYSAVFGAVADLRDKPVLRTDWVKLASMSKAVILT
jgi:hypothetical protein